MLGSALKNLLLSISVVAPWFVGIASGMPSDGLVASFGAYLLTVSFPHLPPVGKVKTLMIAAFIFSFFAMLGAFVSLGSVVFLIAALAASMTQCLGELRGGYFRLPVSLAALAFFLSVGQVPAGGALHYGGVFLLGTLWASLFVWALIPADTQSGAVDGIHLKKDKAAQRFAASIMGISFVGSIIASFVPGSHPCWLPAAGLRVIKPTRAQTVYRMKARGLGTVLGAATGGLILGLAPIPWLHALMVFALLMSMLSIGAKRYGSWSFCLTAIALAFDLQPGANLLEMASNRILLTIGGICIAAAMLQLFLKKEVSEGKA